MENEVSGNFGTAVLGMLMKPDEFDAYQMYHAMKVWCCFVCLQIEFYCWKVDSYRLFYVAKNSLQWFWRSNVNIRIFRGLSVNINRILRVVGSIPNNCSMLLALHQALLVSWFLSKLWLVSFYSFSLKGLGTDEKALIEIPMLKNK